MLLDAFFPYGTVKNKHTKRLLHYHLGRVLHEDLAHVLEDAFFTITDLQWQAQQLTIYISLYHTTHPQDTFDQLTKHTSLIRHHLAQRMSKHLRRVPQLHFVQDPQQHQQQRIEDLLSDNRS